MYSGLNKVFSVNTRVFSTDEIVLMSTSARALQQTRVNYTIGPILAVHTLNRIPLKHSFNLLTIHM